MRKLRECSRAGQAHDRCQQDEEGGQRPTARRLAGAGNAVERGDQRLVIEEIKRAKREGVKVLKVIHGYGSSGKGGALYVGLRKSFGLRKKEAVIKDFIADEDFSIFNDTVLALLEAVPKLRGDPDLGATNEGVTLWLK